MPKYRVTVNFAQVEVEADDEDTAQQDAMDRLEDIEVELIEADENEKC